MKKSFGMVVSVICCAWLSAGAVAGEEKKPQPKAPPKKRVDRQAAEMDYGPFLACTVGAEKGNLTPKAIVVTLDKAKNANICFDTELLRLSAAWTNGYLNLLGRNFANDSNDYPLLEGEIQFASAVRPGWAKEGSFDDPRSPGDPKAPKDGPLPRDWAKYKGLYVHGDKIVFSYSVGAVSVLEMPGVQIKDNAVAFSRTFHVGASEKPLTLLVCEIDKAEQTAGRVGALASNGTDTSGDAEGNVAVLAVKDTATIAGVIGAPKGAQLDASGSRICLKLPPLAAPASFKLVVAKLPAAETATFAELSKGAVENIQEFTKGGVARWTEKITTKGTVSTDAGPYVIDNLTPPEQNPYKSWLRFTALDFFQDGRAALCTWSGDVWIVSGIDEKLENLVWKRFATGLNQPMGLKIVDGVIHTNGRDQITRLHDLNNDGEADFYENFNNDCFLTTNFHECAFDLQTDKDGNFWYAKGSAIWAGSLRMTAHAGTIIKVSKDGTNLEVICNGLRAPNGIGIGPNGEVTCSDNQGNWVPLCPINLIKKGAYYGWVGKDQKSREREKPIFWIPHGVDKSSSGQMWVSDDRWGPFKGHMILTSYDCSVEKVYIEYVDGEAQGGVVKFPFKFPSGLMRGRFNPVDGQFYVCGLRGWSSSAAKECCFQRMRYTGAPVHMPLNVRTTKTGMEVTFTGSLDPAAANDVQNIGAEWFMVNRSGNYGSGETWVSDPKKKGREPVEIKSSKLLADGKTIALEIPGLKPVTNFILKFKLKAADGTPITLDLNYTLHKIPQ